MELVFAPKGRIQIDNARIVYRNFSGAPSKFNREGDRNFALVITTSEMADALIEKGWNVKIKPPREDGEDPFMYLPVKIKFNDRGPNMYLVSGSRKSRLTAETVGMLDDIDIRQIDMDIRPYDWEVNGQTGRTAYLECMQVTQEIDRFAAQHVEEDMPF